jgi:hypothetical protein
MDTDDAEEGDLKIMANIFKTTFEELGSDAFKIRGKVNYTYVNDMGSLFYVDASYGSVFGNLNIALKRIETKFSKLNFDSLTTGSISLGNLDSTNENKAEKKSSVDVQKAYEQFLQQLKETIIDYGRTLKSVQFDEQIFISVSYSNNIDGVPNELTLQVKKSVLESLDKGTISRKEAIKGIDKLETYRYGGDERSYSIPDVSVQQ